ncbi:unnamed protein product, partial [Mesorhabditis belari]|uniref:Organic solute transporter alpha-like protein n=1 Tax=Mesorhabditis belari TaxID=2138241 RepID=A0AAF3ENC8_9BILA
MNLTFVPLASEFWRELPVLFLILEIITFVVVGIIILMTIKMLRDVNLYIEDDMIRRDLVVLLSSPMVVSVLSMIGNCMPRSAELMYAIGLTYLMACLYRVVDLVYKLFGGRQQFSQWLKRNDRVIDFATTPFCCCCKCWPKAEPTPENLQRLQYFVVQSPLVRVIIQVTIIVLILEKVPEDSIANQVLNGLGAVSAITGVYITHILLKMTQDYLEQFNMVVLFKCVNFGQVLFTLLRFNFDIAFKNWKIGYTDVMSSEANGMCNREEEIRVVTPTFSDSTLPETPLQIHTAL